MTTIAWIALALAIALGAYTFFGYPLLLKLARARRPARRRNEVAGRAGEPGEWPMISITVPVYNEAATIAATLERLLQLDYPAERRQILVVSDASTDGTDEIVRVFASRGVELLRVPTRGGKTAAENAALPLLRGEIIVNTDATIHIPAHALRPLIIAFDDPTVGVASGRDVSVSATGQVGNGRQNGNNHGESSYTGYEMWLRQLETNVDGIVGASGCFYAIRAGLHRTAIPSSLSRDFAAALVAREQGFRAISVPEAICFVPRTTSLHGEYRRKVRTMTRGMQTLAYKRHLLSPGTNRRFAWMLFSHKVCRWLVPWAALVGLAALAVLSVSWTPARWTLAAALLLLGAALGGWLWPEGRAPKLLEVPAFLVSGVVAALVASIRTVRGTRQPVWEPTRRPPPASPPSAAANAAG